MSELVALPGQAPQFLEANAALKRRSFTMEKYGDRWKRWIAHQWSLLLHVWVQYWAKKAGIHAGAETTRVCSGVGGDAAGFGGESVRAIAQELGRSPNTLRCRRFIF